MAVSVVPVMAISASLEKMEFSEKLEESLVQNFCNDNYIRCFDISLSNCEDEIKTILTKSCMTEVPDKIQNTDKSRIIENAVACITTDFIAEHYSSYIENKFTNSCKNIFK